MTTAPPDIVREVVIAAPPDEVFPYFTDPVKMIVWKAVDGAPFDLAVSLDLELVVPTSTKARYEADIRLHGLWRLLRPMVAMEGKAGPERELKRLKAQVEETSGMTPAMP